MEEISKEEYIRWKEHKVTKMFFKFCELSITRLEEKILEASPHFQTIGMVGMLQGKRMMLQDLGDPELYELMNEFLESGDKDARN